MSAARRVNPKLAAALQTASVEPFDFDTPGHIVEVPVPVEHFTENPEPEKSQPSRFDRVKSYLEATRQPEVPPDFGLEADVSAAREADARRDFGNSMLAAGQAFTGNRRAVGQLQQTNANEAAALSQNAARRKALEEWVANRERTRLAEAGVLSSALAEPARKDPEFEKRRLDLQEGEIERRKADDAADEQFRRDKLNRPKGAKVSKDASALRKEFNALPEVKDFKDVDTAFQKIQGAAKNVSAAGDLSLIFGYMKMLDPGSTVREGEFANAQNAGGVDDKVAAAYNNVRSGQRLTDAQRADFIAQARGLYEAQRKAYSAAAQRYRGLAERAGLAPDDVAVDRPGDAPDQSQEPRLKVRRKADGVVKMLPKSKADELAKGGKFEVVP